MYVTCADSEPQSAFQSSERGGTYVHPRSTVAGFTFRSTTHSTVARFYLIVGSALSVAYEICLSLLLGYGHTSAQVIELGVVNYLWPCLTVLLAIVMNGQKARWMIVPGSMCTLCGIFWVISGDGLEISKIFDRIT